MLMCSPLLHPGLPGRLPAAQEGPAPTIPQLTKDGDAAYLKGDYEAARQAFTRAWELAQETPKDNPVRYDILKRLTSVRAAAGEFADADNWLQQAITWRENTLGRKDHKIADDLLISVSLCRRMKDFDRALAILRRVQSMHVEAYTFDSPMVADDFSRTGSIYAEQKKLENAINSIAAPRHPHQTGRPARPFADSRSGPPGRIHTLMRAYDEAEAAFRHVLVIRETLYGKTHPDLISTVDGLAYALFGQQKYDEADPVYQRLIGLWESSVGKDHAMVAVALDKVAVFYSAQKKYPEVREALERSTAIRARFLAMGISQQATAGIYGRANRAGEGVLPARTGRARPAEPDQRRSARAVRSHAQGDGGSAGEIRRAGQAAAHSAEEDQQALIYSAQELSNDRFPFGFGRAAVVGAASAADSLVSQAAVVRSKRPLWPPTPGDGISLARGAGFAGARSGAVPQISRRHAGRTARRQDWALGPDVLQALAEIAPAEAIALVPHLRAGATQAMIAALSRANHTDEAMALYGRPPQRLPTAGSVRRIWLVINAPLVPESRPRATSA